MKKPKQHCFIVFLLQTIFGIAIGTYVMCRDFSNMAEPFGTIDLVVFLVLFIGLMIMVLFGENIND